MAGIKNAVRGDIVITVCNVGMYDDIDLHLGDTGVVRSVIVEGTPLIVINVTIGTFFSTVIKVIIPDGTIGWVNGAKCTTMR